MRAIGIHDQVLGDDRLETLKHRLHADPEPSREGFGLRLTEALQLEQNGVDRRLHAASLRNIAILYLLNIGPPVNGKLSKRRGRPRRPYRRDGPLPKGRRRFDDTGKGHQQGIAEEYAARCGGEEACTCGGAQRGDGRLCGTDGSNPSPSSGESVGNLIPLPVVASPNAWVSRSNSLQVAGGRRAGAKPQYPPSVCEQNGDGHASTIGADRSESGQGSLRGRPLLAARGDRRLVIIVRPELLHSCDVREEPLARLRSGRGAGR